MMEQLKACCESENKGSDEIFEMYCEACHRDGLHEKASAFCSICVTYFCSNCLKHHERFFPGHKPQTGDSIPQDICLEKCETHKNEILKYFCTTCKKFVCTICKTEQHDEACIMTNLLEYVNKIESGDELKELISSKNDVAKRLSDCIGVIDKEHERISSSTAAVKDVIKEEKDAMLSIFEQFDDDLSKLEELIQKKQANPAIDSVKETFEQLRIETDKLLDNIKIMDQFPNNRRCSRFMEIRSLNERHKQIQDILDGLVKDLSKRDKQFEDTLSNQSNALIKRVRDFGETSANFLKSCGKERRKNATFVENIMVKDSLDKEECCVSDLCILSEQYFVLSDRSNKCLKLLDINSKQLLQRRSVKTTPEGITKIRDAEIAVTRLIEKGKSRSKIEFLKLTNTKQLVFMNRYIYTDMFCVDIKYIGDDMLVLALTHEFSGKIQIRNLNGRIMYSIDEYYEENKVRFPYYLHLCETDKHVYISDWLNDCFYQLDTETRSVIQIPNHIWHPLGITSDKEGFIYVCEAGTNSINLYHREDTENSAKQVLLRFDQYTPGAVQFSVSMSKLFVSFDDADVIKVYNIVDPQI